MRLESGLSLELGMVLFPGVVFGLQTGIEHLLLVETGECMVEV